jgi:hypothetical protein
MRKRGENGSDSKPAKKLVAEPLGMLEKPIRGNAVKHRNSELQIEWSQRIAHAWPCQRIQLRRDAKMVHQMPGDDTD